MNCRWSRSHTNLTTFKQIEKPKDQQIPIIEENESINLCLALRKKKYTFEFNLQSLVFFSPFHSILERNSR